MKMSAAMAIGAMTAICGCSYQPSPDDLTQAEVDQIVSKCGGAREHFQVNKGWLVMIEPLEGDSVGTCVVEEVRKTGKKRISLVGNMMYTTEEGK